MNRIGNLAVALLVTFACSLAIVSGTEAGTFTMRQCEGAKQLDFQGVYGTVNGSSRFDTVSGCNLAGSGELGIYQDRSGTKITYGEGGQFRWDAPSGIELIGSAFSARLNDQNGLTAELIGSNGATITDLDGGIPHDGEKHSADWWGTFNPQNLVVARVVCMTTAGCENKTGGAKAFIEVNDIELTARDVSSPTLAASGELWDWAGDSLYHRGNTSITVKANDQGSGVAAAWVEVNGFRVDFPVVSCPGDQGAYATRFSPCPLSYSGTRSMNTSLAPFQDGVNLLRLCVRDYADTESGASKTCTAYRALRVDNQPSNPPVDLRSDEGTAWQPENGFTLRWENPEGQVAPVIGAVYRLYDLGTGQLVDSRFFGGSDLREAGPVEVPAVGAYRAAVSLVDGA
ncbi:MAG: hypothetical protein KDB48_03960, partial [Solirubrobacterales bacterium]|nr:hypothetical protein [Solirubrobacterales bacterium]